MAECEAKVEPSLRLAAGRVDLEAARAHAGGKLDIGHRRAKAGILGSAQRCNRQKRLHRRLRRRRKGGHRRHHGRAGSTGRQRRHGEEGKASTHRRLHWKAYVRLRCVEGKVLHANSTRRLPRVDVADYRHPASSSRPDARTQHWLIAACRESWGPAGACLSARDLPCRCRAACCRASSWPGVGVGGGVGVKRGPSPGM